MSNNMQRIVLIDDDIKLEDKKQQIISSFKDSGIDLILCEDKDQGLEVLSRLKNIDCIILDWYLGDGDNSLESQLILKYLRKTSFTPVIIYSAHIASFQNEYETGQIDYPSNLIKDIDKSEFSHDKVYSLVSDFYKKNKVGQLSSLYRHHILSKLENVFFDLNSLQASDLSSVLKFIAGDNLNVDWESDFVLNLIHRKLVTDSDFFEPFIKLLSAIPSYKKGDNQKELNAFINKILYFTSDTKFIHSGDIIEIQAGELIKYCIVISPDCDIEQKNTRFISLIELRIFDDQSLDIYKGNDASVGGRLNAIKDQNHPSYYYFPAVKIGDKFLDFVAVLKSLFSVEEAEVPAETKYPCASHRLQFNSKFLMNNVNATLKLVCSYSNPYKSDFLHSVNAHNSRIGTPDIKNLWK